MVVRNKLYRIIEKYRRLLEIKTVGITNKHVLGGIRSKNLILDFYLKNNRWPSKLSENKKEKRLALRFENYVSKEALSYDPNFRRLAMVTGRTTNNKRKHNVQGFKKEILEFIEEHGRVPSINPRSEIVEGEAQLRNKLNYYTVEKNDTTLLGKIYKLDRCHRSGIPSKFRAVINKSLDIEKPLIRLVKEA